MGRGKRSRRLWRYSKSSDRIGGGGGGECCVCCLEGAEKRRAVVVGEGVVNSPGSDGGCNSSATDRGSGNAGDEKSAAGEAFIPAT
jgi:hypothetical protein